MRCAERRLRLLAMMLHDQAEIDSCCTLLLRPDRAIFAATSYVANALGRKFVEPPVLDLGETLGDSTPLSPLIFVLSAGVDPTQILRKLALERGMSSKFFTVALGQGQVSALSSLLISSLVQVLASSSCCGSPTRHCCASQMHLLAVPPQGLNIYHCRHKL